MVYFGAEVEGTPELMKFISDTKTRLSDKHIAKNPYKEAEILYLPNTLVYYAKPIYLLFPLYASIFISIVTFMFVGLNYSIGYIISLVFLSLTFFWSKWFTYPLLKIGLKKAGYKGNIKLLSTEELFKRLIKWDSRKY